MFQVGDHAQMKPNLRKIDTYGLSPHILIAHRKTVFWVSEEHETIGGEGVLRIYPICMVYDMIKQKYVYKKIDFYLAYLNPEMFEKVQVIKIDGKNIVKKVLTEEINESSENQQ